MYIHRFIYNLVAVAVAVVVAVPVPTPSTHHRPDSKRCKGARADRQRLNEHRAWRLTPIHCHLSHFKSHITFASLACTLWPRWSVLDRAPYG